MRKTLCSIVLLLAILLSLAPGGNNTAQADAPGADLDVTYISRTPLYSRAADSPQMWPAENEPVTFTAHVINKGAAFSDPAAFQWLVDDVVVSDGTIPGLAPGLYATQDLHWTWKTGRHTVEFRVDPNNTIAEFSEANNAIRDYTDAITLGFWVERSVYDLYNSRLNGRGTYSWEDWAQMIVAKMNNMFETSVYPLAPQGAQTRVRLDMVTLADDGTLFGYENNFQHAPILLTNDGQWGFSWDEYKDANYDQLNAPWWVIHELMHYTFNRIDLYAFDVQGGDVFVRGDDNALIAGTPQLPYLMYDVVRYTNRNYDLMHTVGTHKIFSEYTIYGLNRDFPAGKRGQREDWDYYFNQLPANTRIRLIDSTGQAMPGVQVSAYQAVPGDERSGPYSQNFDNIADISGVTDGDGILALGGQPFGPNLKTYGTPSGVLLLKLNHPAYSGSRYTWLELTDLNMAYWRGQSQVYTQDIRFPNGPTELRVSQNTLVINAARGYNPQPAAVQVEALGSAPRYWSIGQPNVPWIHTLPSAGLDDTGFPSGPLYLAFDTKNLPAGGHFGQVSVSADGAANSPQEIYVYLNVVEPKRSYLPAVMFQIAPPQPWFSFSSLSTDTELGSIECTNWPACRGASYDNWQLDGYLGATINANYFSDRPRYEVKRIFLTFDTSAIPANATITAAQLKLHAGAWPSGNTFLHVVRSYAVPGQKPRFDGIQFTSGGSAEAQANALLTINLDTAALSWIRKGGFTNLALIHDYDLNDIQPSRVNELQILMSESGSKGPVLQVQYTVP